MHIQADIPHKPHCVHSMDTVVLSSTSPHDPPHTWSKKKTVFGHEHCTSYTQNLSGVHHRHRQNRYRRPRGIRKNKNNKQTCHSFAPIVLHKNTLILRWLPNLACMYSAGKVCSLSSHSHLDTCQPHM